MEEIQIMTKCATCQSTHWTTIEESKEFTCDQCKIKTSDCQNCSICGSHQIMKFHQFSQKCQPITSFTACFSCGLFSNCPHCHNFQLEQQISTVGGHTIIYMKCLECAYMQCCMKYGVENKDEDIIEKEIEVITID